MDNGGTTQVIEQPRPYQPPKLTELGRVADLTLWHNKQHGHSDGFTFLGHEVTQHSF
ncbi:MAG TPA: lasso RiPP family leader peptide-containing protein [Gaiellaceae bacterium]|nr:lasso RiPP family leader peptide-containing protein [Gaiellaceae bacterium]